MKTFLRLLTRILRACVRSLLSSVLTRANCRGCLIVAGVTYRRSVFISFGNKVNRPHCSLIRNSNHSVLPRLHLPLVVHSAPNPVNPPLVRLPTGRPKLGHPTHRNLSLPRGNYNPFLRRAGAQRISRGVGRDRRSPLSALRQKPSKRRRRLACLSVPNGSRLRGGMYTFVGICTECLAQVCEERDCDFVLRGR